LKTAIRNSWIVLALACMASSFTTLAQAKGTVTCTVLDDSGQPVAKKDIVLTSSGGKQTKKKTNEQGEVKFTGVEDGAYSIALDGAVPGRVEVSGADTPCKYNALSAATANAKISGVMDLIKERKYPEAEAEAKKVVDLMPGEATAHYALAVAYAYTGNEQAGAEADKAAELSPDRFKDKVNLIKMQAINVQAENDKKKGDFNSAIKRYQSLQGLAPNDPTVYYNMAVTYGAMKNYDEALKNLDKVIALKPDDQDAKALRARFEKALDEQLSRPLGK